MVYKASISLCSKDTSRGVSASGESVGTGIDGHPSMSNTGGSTGLYEDDPESRSEELINGKKEEEEQTSEKGPGSEPEVSMLIQLSRNLGDATGNTTRAFAPTRGDTEYCPERGTAPFVAQQHSHQVPASIRSGKETRSANTNKSASPAGGTHMGLTNQSRKGSEGKTEQIKEEVSRQEKVSSGPRTCARPTMNICQNLESNDAIHRALSDPTLSVQEGVGETNSSRSDQGTREKG